MTKSYLISCEFFDLAQGVSLQYRSRQHGILSLSLCVYKEKDTLKNPAKVYSMGCVCVCDYVCVFGERMEGTMGEREISLNQLCICICLSLHG